MYKITAPIFVLIAVLKLAIYVATYLGAITSIITIQFYF